MTSAELLTTMVRWTSGTSSERAEALRDLLILAQSGELIRVADHEVYETKSYNLLLSLVFRECGVDPEFRRPAIRVCYAHWQNSPPAKKDTAINGPVYLWVFDQVTIPRQDLPEVDLVREMLQETVGLPHVPELLRDVVQHAQEAPQDWHFRFFRSQRGVPRARLSPQERVRVEEYNQLLSNLLLPLGHTVPAEPLWWRPSVAIGAGVVSSEVFDQIQATPIETRLKLLLNYVYAVPEDHPLRLRLLWALQEIGIDTSLPDTVRGAAVGRMINALPHGTDVERRFLESLLDANGRPKYPRIAGITGWLLRAGFKVDTSSSLS